MPRLTFFTFLYEHMTSELETDNLRYQILGPYVYHMFERQFLLITSTCSQGECIIITSKADFIFGHESHLKPFFLIRMTVAFVDKLHSI